MACPARAHAHGRGGGATPDRATRSVDGVQAFSNLKSLVLDNNELSDTLVLPQLPQLRTLSINNNKIEDLDRFIEQVKRATPELHHLSLLKNPACPNDLLGGDDEDYKRYRCACEPRVAQA